MDIQLHFRITPSGRIKFNWKPNDVRLEFYETRKGRRASTIEAVGKAFIQIAKKAKELEQYQ